MKKKLLKMTWQEFKVKTEQLFENWKLEECWGFQIQSGTKWNTGLDNSQIEEVEKLFGFGFPDEYKRMLSELNGFDRDAISINPEKVEEEEFARNCYQYPVDFTNVYVQSLIQEINTNIKYAHETLINEGFNATDILGFIPLYAHRALVVFNDKTLCPVISVHGSDIIIYGKSLLDYWVHEFELEYHK